MAGAWFCGCTHQQEYPRCQRYGPEDAGQGLLSGQAVRKQGGKHGHSRVQRLCDGASSVVESAGRVLVQSPCFLPQYGVSWGNGGKGGHAGRPELYCMCYGPLTGLPQQCRVPEGKEKKILVLEDRAV